MHIPILALTLMLPAAPNTLWFAGGHRIIAHIAEVRLTEHSKAVIRELLNGESLADASVWADQIKGTRRQTSPLHYVNIPLSAKEYDPARDCPRDRCIIAALTGEIETLSSKTASTARRAEALRFVIHLVGDLHQPLHVSNDDDRGGNLTQVRFMGRGTNLHSVWDGELYQSRWDNDGAYLDYLLTELQKVDLERMEQGTITDWAMEGHHTGVNAYKFMSRQLGEEYVRRQLPHVDLALIRAGVRLAKVLNEALRG